jgi:hypothetical protein
MLNAIPSAVPTNYLAKFEKVIQEALKSTPRGGATWTKDVSRIYTGFLHEVLSRELKLSWMMHTLISSKLVSVSLTNLLNLYRLYQSQPRMLSSKLNVKRLPCLTLLKDGNQTRLSSLRSLEASSDMSRQS